MCAESQEERTRSWRSLALCATERARELILYRHAKKLEMLPLALHADETFGTILTVVMSAPLCPKRIAEARFIAGCEVIAESAPCEVVKRAIFAAYRGGGEVLSQAAKEVRESAKARHVEIPAEPSSSHPIPTLLDAIVSRAIALDASDIHLEPCGQEARVRYRVDGVLREESGFSLGLEDAERVLRRVRVLADLDLTARNVPQEGAFEFCSSGLSVRNRVSIVPHVHGEKLVVRLFHGEPSSAVEKLAHGLDLSSLGLTEQQRQLLLLHLGAGRGTVVLSGPTGSGKTTLLYAALSHLNVESRNIVTIEDPVERILLGINQTEVQAGSDLGYHSLLIALLRQDPEVIMIGEIREPQTAGTAFTAGITGHLVLCTVHAGSCLEVFPRLSYLGVENELISSSLSLVISSRLIPKNCVHCRKLVSPPESLHRLFDLSLSVKFFSATGCEQCTFSTVLGRHAVYEFLPTTGAFFEMLEASGEGASPTKGVKRETLRVAAEAVGYKPLAHEVRRLLVSGTISPYHALLAIGIAPEVLGIVPSGRARS